MDLSAWLVLPVACALVALGGACSVYDSSLLGSGGASSQSGSGAGGPCNTVTDCPGDDSDCARQSCESGACKSTFAMAGTLVAMQLAGDCQQIVCDGMGSTISQNDDTDVPNDGKQCTTDSCSGGSPVETPKTAGQACTDGGGHVCDGKGACVACVDGTDCPSGVCAQNTCQTTGCSDMMKDGNETDTDCGGDMCLPCQTGQACLQPSDCVGGVCTSLQCAPTCTDRLQNNGESDVDCGGVNCAPCQYGQQCTVNSDCVTASCKNLTCACAGTCACDHLVISEIRSRGAGGASDEFIELFNPTGVSVTLDNQWKIEGRSASGSSYTTKWTGTGIVVPSRGHALIAGSAYTQSPAADSSLSAGITDAASIRLVHDLTVIVDAVCYAYNATTTTELGGAGFSCEGTPVSNLPHNDGTSGTSNVDASIERKPGGSQGNCTDAGNNASDFQQISPAKPQSTKSPTT